MLRPMEMCCWTGLQPTYKELKPPKSDITLDKLYGLQPTYKELKHNLKAAFSLFDRMFTAYL